MRNEQKVRKGFWNKVKETAGKVPFIVDAIALYFCAMDSKTPIAARISIYIALAYFISPLDAIPDVLPGGFVDDATAIAAVLAVAKAYITDEHREKAQQWLHGAKFSTSF